MVTTATWVLLSYRVPREPSTPRIAIWRRLGRLGVAKLGDGLVALPYDATTKEALEWVANEILEANGQATIWIATPTVRRFGRDLAEQIRTDRAAEYRALVERTSDIEHGVATTRSLRSLRAEFRRVDRRDYFPPPERAEALRAIESVEASSLSADL